MSKSVVRLLFVGLLVLLVAVPIAAQDVVADGLANPRNMSYDADGNLYVALAGVGGSFLTSDDSAYGASAGVAMIDADGNVSNVVNGLISYREGNSLGASDVFHAGDSLWVTLGENSDLTIPFSNALVELDAETGRVLTYVDILSTELNDDPDGNPNGQSNPTDFAVADDGSVVIANAGCNCLMTWSADAGLEVAVVWDFESDNPVPTAVDIGPDGDIYVGFLTGFPFPAEGSRIERWSGGELVETFEGLTAVTSVLVTDAGDVYAVEFGVFDQGWGPGRVVKVSADGIETVLGDLTSPYGLAQAPDGTLVVSTNSIGGEDGQIIAVSMGE